jgi:hypothetical protein
MRRWPVTSTVFLACTALFLEIAAASATPYASPKGYQITPAAGWKVNSSGIMGSDVVLFAAPSHGFAANLNVVINPTPSNETLRDVDIELKKALQQTLQNYKTLSTKYSSVNGAKALVLSSSYTIGSPAKLVHSRQIIAEHNHLTYSFTCTDLAENAQAYDPAFKQMVTSIKWTK